MKRKLAPVLAAMIAFACLVPDVESRPLYRTEFVKKYRPYLDTRKLTCGVCHTTRDKKRRNLYGMAIAKHINASEQDPQHIRDVLEIVHNEESHIPGKTWGELITGRIFPKPTGPLPDPTGDRR